MDSAVWPSVIAGAMVMLTIIGAAWALSGSIGRIAASTDHMAERVDGIAADVKQYVETQSQHGERLAGLEARMRAQERLDD